MAARIEVAGVAHAALAGEAEALAEMLGASVHTASDGVVIGLSGKAAHVAEFGTRGRAPRPVLAPAAAAAAGRIAEAVGRAVAEHLRMTLGAR